MFGLLDDIVEAGSNMVGSAVETVTFGVVEKQQAVNLLALGYTIYEISEMTGIAVEVLKEHLGE